MKTKSFGKVYLVGAGPGDPELLTVKAARLLESSEIVVYDRLIGVKILDIIPSSAEAIFVGKVSRKHRNGSIGVLSRG